MRIPASILAGALVALSSGVACTHASGTLPVDAPKVLPYEAPDIDEISGVDSSEEADDKDGAGPARSQQAPSR